MVALHWEKYIQHARDKYNREHALQLPPITPHVCRHTFCSNMAREGINPKTLQYLMGHSDIAVTMIPIRNGKKVEQLKFIVSSVMEESPDEAMLRYNRANEKLNNRE